MNKKPAIAHGIRLKKQYGQNFLRDRSVVDHMIDNVTLTPQTSIFEIGCGDGFLTTAILERKIARLWVFEIDAEWAAHVGDKFAADNRLTVFEQNFLDIDFARLEPHKPWTILANLPYQVTFPILYTFQKHRDLISEGVVMVQEEVAQKIVKTSGRGYGYPSLFLQYYFDVKLLRKIPPSAFYPAPKIYSRLLYLKPRLDVASIPAEREFWKFIKICFRQPRRTLRNNLEQSHYNLTNIPAETLALRAQQMGIQDFLTLWERLRV